MQATQRVPQDGVLTIAPSGPREQLREVFAKDSLTSDPFEIVIHVHLKNNKLIIKPVLLNARSQTMGNLLCSFTACNTNLKWFEELRYLHFHYSI